MARQPAVPIAGFPLKFTMVLKTPTKTLTEVHWHATLETDNATTQAINDDATALATARIATLPNDCSMVEWNLSQENVYRDAYSNLAPLPDSLSYALAENLGNDC